MVSQFGMRSNSSAEFKMNSVLTSYLSLLTSHLFRPSLRRTDNLNQSLTHEPLHRLCDAFFVVRSRNPLGRGFDGVRCIPHGNAEADFLQHFQVVQSVADGCRVR